MSVAGVRNRDSFGTVAGPYRVLAGDTGLITLVPAPLLSTIYVQKIHIQITTPSVGERWTFQDGAGIPLVPAVSADGIAHFDFNFGPDGVPCTEATAFVLNITGATGAVGWITWSAYRVLTRSAAASRYADLVLADRPTGYWRLNDAEGYAQAVLSDAPSSYWRLNEPSGLTAVDLVGGKNGTITGGVTLAQPGALASGDKAMTFDGTTGKIVTAANVPLTVPFTIEAWVRVAALGTYNVLFSTRGASATVARFAIIIYPGGTLNVSWQYPNDTPATVFVATTTVPFVAGPWYHVAVVFNALSIALYVNGASIPVDNPGPFAPALVGSTVPLTFATDSPFTPNWLNGSLDEVALYNVALSAQQIANHYALRTSPIATTTPATAADSSGNGHDGTITGGVILGVPGAIPGNTGMTFDGGVASNISLGTMPSPAVCSYEAWMKTTDPTTQCPILGNYNGGLAGLFFGKQGTKLFTYAPLIGDVMVSVAPVNTGAWVHVVATWDGTTTRMYINGAFDSARVQPNQASDGRPWWIGHAAGTPPDWLGSLAEVAFYGYVLTPAQILAHFQAASRP